MAWRCIFLLSVPHWAFCLRPFQGYKDIDYIAEIKLFNAIYFIQEYEVEAEFYHFP
jgi:hypothetical protein